MKPLIVVVGATYDDARRYVLANMDARPLLKVAVLVSASAASHTVDVSRVQKIIETPGARFGRNYDAVMSLLRQSVAKAKPPLT